MAKANVSHDLSFLTQSGVEIGLMLAKGTTASTKDMPLYQETEDTTLAYQIYSGEPGYANLPPDREIQIGQTDWRAGVGQEFYDKSQPNRYWKSIGCDLRFTGQATAGPKAFNSGTTPAIAKPTGVVRAAADFNDKLYIGVDDMLCVLDADGDTFAVFACTGDFSTSDFNDGLNITDLKVYGDYLFIARGAANKYLYMDTSATPVITTSTITDGVADLFQVVDTTLWKALASTAELKSSTNAINGGSWTTATTVGATTDNITGLLTESGQLFVMKEDMPYYLDTDGNVHRLIPELKTTQTSTNGTNSDVWQAKLYIPCGTQGLIEYDNGVVTWRSPAKFCSNISEFTGQIQAVTHDEEWLFAITDNGNYLEVQGARAGTSEVGADWVWHPIAELTLTGCQIAWVSSVYKKRLYIASTVNSETLTYYPLPTTYGNADADTNYVFGTGGYFITPWFSANFRADYKSFIKLTLECENVGANDYITASYRIQGKTDFKDIGNYISTYSTKYLPDYSTGVKPTSTLIQFKFTWKVTDTSTCPRLLSFDCRGVWYPTRRNIITCTVLCADGLAARNGTDDGQTGAVIKAAIEEARDTATWPVTFYDRDGNTIYVKVLSAKYRATSDTKDKNPEGVIDLVLMKVPLA